MTLDANKLDELADRVERLTGPDWEVDAEIALASGWLTFNLEGFGVRWQRGHGTVERSHPFYTASLDAAMTLVPEGRGWAIEVPSESVSGRIADKTLIVQAEIFPNPHILTRAATPALALTAACLRALAKGS